MKKNNIRRVVKIPTQRLEERKNKINDLFIKSFSKVPPGIYRNEEFLKKNRNAITLLWFLYNNVIRKPIKSDDLNIYGNYFRKGFLACSMSVNEIAKKFGYGSNKASIRRWLEDLEKDELLTVDCIELDKHRTQNIYVLGWHKNNDDFLYLYMKYDENIRKRGAQNEPQVGLKMSPTIVKRGAQNEPPKE